MADATLGVIVGNRGFFPDELADSGRKEILDALAGADIDVVALSPDETPFGSVETYEDSKKCAELFKKHSDEIDGILVTLPNFGDERGVANSIRLSGLDVPVLVHAFPDDRSRMTIESRRDSFCGKISVCNALAQYGIPFSLTKLHTEALGTPEFVEDLRAFVSVCKVVRGLHNARIGAIGVRPAAFNTVRYSEKLLEMSGISVEVIDLSEILGKVNRLSDSDPAVAEKLDAVKSYVCTSGIPDDALLRMAKLGTIIDRWVSDNELSATAIQCWTSLQENYGIVPCTLMSMMSDSLVPSACEVDVTGVIGMYALQLASGKPSAITDWNNNFGDDPDKLVLFHCSNLPRSVFCDARMDYQAIIAGTVGRDNTYGTVVGRIKSGAFTYARVATDDVVGTISAYTGEGEFVDDPVDTFGGFGVARIPNLQGLLKYVCKLGFEHHVAINLSKSAGVIEEAFSTYLGWDVYNHSE